VSNVGIPRRGLSHLGLATRDGDGTIAFYDGVLGFPLVFCNIEPEDGRSTILRHMFFDMGNNEMFTFVEKPKWDGEGQDPLEVTASEYHFAFNAVDDADLQARREQLQAAGIPVTEIVQVGVEYPDGEQLDTAHSIYFRDPVNDILLEFTAFVRDFNERDIAQKPVFSANHSTPAFFEAFLGPKRYAAMKAKQLAPA
jgi:catechol 2,3-dioxygenase-like lactoylglutathione lyase family enzyme